ncbi:MAG: tRNA lysidine(34) synthetase TilS [Bacillota bacterium]|nr:tRNA lysidine(34) synthetase TilS [Bacillota bacterium]
MNHSLPKLVEQTIRSKELLAAGDHVIVACSGGADSVALLSILHELRQALGIEIHAFHFNHMLRGEEADRDQRYTEDICEALGIPCHVEKAHVQDKSRAWGMSFEEAGRILRYGALDHLRGEIATRTSKRVRIATAHHSGDVAETFLLNLFRGSGSDGLASIAYRNGHVIRPLLGASRDQVEAYLREREIPWCEDSTNRDIAHRRNRVRQLLPLLSERLEIDVVRAIVRTTELLKDERDFWEAHMDAIWGRHARTLSERQIRLVDTDKLHKAEYRRLIRRSLQVLLGSAKDISAHDVESILQLRQVGSHVAIRKGVDARRSYAGIEIVCADVEASSAGGSEALGANAGDPEDRDDRLIVVEHSLSPDSDLPDWAEDPKVAWIDADKVIGALRVRRRQAGDRFVPFGMTGSKSLKKYFIDCKVEREERERLRIVVDDEKIVWIEGLRTSELVRIDEKTKRVLSLRFG